ncbi:glycosyl hydrolase family 28 protein [Actinophytocola sp.]|uniref:glycosyl hydrolase family 28 protein n=1 Tax=Actinophytocola sp. TaxID=1872138 RepID=UPI0038999BA1
MLRRLIGVASALALATGGLLVAPGAAGAATYNVRDYGATGNGSSNDTPAIQRAIDAAAGAGGGTVQFPSGTYQSRNTIHMRSHITLRLDSGATVRGASNDDYDSPESNPNDEYQDYGHSHFHNAMIYGDRLTDIGFVGAGVIDGGGNLITGNPKDGEADKIISLTRCDGLRVGDGLTLRRGGHFAMLINGCTNVTSDRLRIDTASDRDGWNVISTTNVRITNANIAANDDALVFKSDYALGAKLSNGNVVVTDSHLSARCCNALMFGSETCGDFTGYDFQRITIDGADKSGLGIVSMDGSVISDVHYRDITMTNVRAAITQKIGTRRRCGNSPGVGRIHDITYDNITSSGQADNNFTATLWGESGSNRISDVTFNNVNLNVPGGNGAVSTGVPSNDPSDYNPKSIGTRPSYGWYIRNADNIRFTGGSVHFEATDARPAVIANNSTGVVFDPFVAERGSASTDMLFQTVTGYCVRNGTNTTGGALRVSQTGSTESCGTQPPPTGRFEAEAGLCQGTIDANHAGFSGTGFCNTTNAVGSAEEWTVPRAAAGTATLVFGFANGTADARPMDVTVNGTSVGTLTFDGTGAWTTWRTASVQVPMVAGDNTVRLTSGTAGGGPNVDYVDVA